MQENFNALGRIELTARLSRNGLVIPPGANMFFAGPGATGAAGGGDGAHLTNMGRLSYIMANNVRRKVGESSCCWLI